MVGEWGANVCHFLEGGTWATLSLGTAGAQHIYLKTKQYIPGEKLSDDTSVCLKWIVECLPNYWCNTNQCLQHTK